MPRKTRCAAFIVALCAGCAPPTIAQPWTARVLVDANVAMNTTGSTFTDSFRYQHPYSANIPGEEASVDTSFKIPTPAMFEGGFLVRAYRNVAAGVAFYQANSTKDLRIDARIPHPFFIGRHRAVEGTTPVRHEETGVHLLAAYLLPATRRILVVVSGGPSYFSVTQGMVKTVAITETYPYDEASFASASAEPVKQSGWGFNVGADVSWMFTKHIGAGGLVRYARATLALEPANREARNIDVGGLHAGIGARVAF